MDERAPHVLSADLQQKQQKCHQEDECDRAAGDEQPAGPGTADVPTTD
jgi:hypothetical protein